MSDVTRILSAIESGDDGAAAKLLPLVYDELRRLASQRLASEKPGQTLQATALVHEAYIRLVDVEEAQNWDGRSHFFAAAAKAIRRILVERAHQRGRLKHGGDRLRYTLGEGDLVEDLRDDELLALDEALSRLYQDKPEIGRAVQLRFFAGMTNDEVADVMGTSSRTIKRHWTYGRAWLRREMERDEQP